MRAPVSRVSRRLPLRILAISSFLALAGCWSNDNRVAGGGGVDVEGISVEGTAMLSDHTPAIAAQVRIRTWDYLRTEAALKTAVDKADTVTDSLGRFRVKGLDTGRYAIQVDAGTNGATLLEIDADGSQPVLRVDALLQSMGTLSGIIRDGNGQAVPGSVVTVLGLDRNALTDSTGTFTIVNVPPGTYIVRATPPPGVLSILEIPEVVVNAGGKTALDSVVLPVSVPDILAQWRFDEGKGEVGGEASGSNARAALKGSAGWFQDARGQSLALKDSGYAFVPRSKSATLDIKDSADFTLSVWMNADTAAGMGASRKVVDARAAYSPNGYAIGIAAGGGAEFLFQCVGSATTFRIAGNAPLTTGVWHLLVAGRSGTRYFLYADGTLLSETQGPVAALAHENPLFFGSQEGKRDFFTGLIRDVRIYRHALSAGEVEALAN